MEKVRRFTIPLPVPLHRRFKLRAFTDDKLMTDFLIEVLEKELDRADQKAAKTTSRSELRA
jgi:hypothetical protein